MRASQILGRFYRDDTGTGTLTSLFLAVTCLLLGGGAVDISNAWRVSEILQSSAEASAISAAIRASEPLPGDETPKQVAKRIAQDGLRYAQIENAWHDESFEMGFIDPVTGSFVPMVLTAGRSLAPVPTAVRVTLNRDTRHGTAEPLLFVKLFGYDPWNIKGRAVAEIRARTELDCPDPLLSLQTRVDVSELDVFLGICLLAEANIDYGAKPFWKNGATDRLVNQLLTQSLGLQSANLFGLTPQLQPQDLRDAIGTATQNIKLNDLDDLQVLSNGSFYVNCEENEVLRLGEGFLVQNAAIFSECPVRFDGEVKLEASLVISNLTSLLRDLDQVSLRPDAILTGSPPCAPGNGVRILLFVDLAAMANIPAVISTDTPLGAFLDETVETTGTLVSETVGLLGGIVNPLVRDISEITTNLQLLPICLNAQTMLHSDTIVLR
ncbi:hypothetical protein [Puniceibacterium sp. IMCC21224]|uniref:hypothetical protein n=1 Tax=Puniceibacterium sp. IMCC21224 TaxID=1618204 RepID=UPI00064DB19F|nr:hypothetical protein [Puniceibacterium sp. IMCC21224]KMK67641.1 hypothetical protein IMCC21224_112513 [Puniceibacterium sp. IMCC21224]